MWKRARREARPSPSGSGREKLERYRRLLEGVRDIFAEQGLEALFERLAATLAELVPHSTLALYLADEGERVLLPVFAQGRGAREVLRGRVRFGVGSAGRAAAQCAPVQTKRAELSGRRGSTAAGKAAPREALLALPLLARGSLKGVLELRRGSEQAAFSAEELELARQLGEAAALALDNAQIRAWLEQQAASDPLTGLGNRRVFEQRLRAELTRASRAREPVALLLLDLDKFKQVNDRHGHSVGDEVLLGLAALLQATVRVSDTACRLGGDEFALIMPACETSGALAVARRLAAQLAELEFGRAGSATLSIGITHAPEHALEPEELLACADAALLAAKAAGGNQSVCFAEQASERH